MLVNECKLCAAVQGLEKKRDQRLPLWHSGPFPGEYQLRCWYDVPIDPGRIVHVAVEQPEDDAESTAGPDIGNGAQRRPRVGAPPLNHQLWLRDCRPDLR